MDNLDNLASKELIYHMLKINESFDELKRSIRLEDVIGTEVFKLPKIEKGKEHLELKSIRVEHLKGEKAFYEAKRSFFKVYAETGASTKAVFRLPGFIQLDSSAGNRNIKNIVNEINQHKILFKNEVQKIKGAKKRHDVIHQSFPSLITKQLYRSLYCVEENSDEVNSLGFCWANKFVTYITSKKEVMDLLKEQEKSPPKNSTTGDWEHFIKKEINLIETLPDDIELRYKRSAKISAAINLGGMKPRQLSGHLPIIVLQKKPITISPLISYDSAYKRCIRSDSKIGGIPIIQRLNLYAKNR